MIPKRTQTFPGRYDQVREIVQFVAEGAAEAGLDEDAIFHVELCCDEACTNIIEHAYGEEDVGEIRVSYRASLEEFEIVIYDNGRSFDPDQIPQPLTSGENATPKNVIDNLKVGGLGVHFMRKLMDDVQFQFDDSGNTLTLIKEIPKADE